MNERKEASLLAPLAQSIPSKMKSKPKAKPKPKGKQTRRKSKKRGRAEDENDYEEEEEDHQAKRAKLEEVQIVQSDTKFKQSALITGATLKDYQLDGVEWMVSLDSNGASGILGTLLFS